MSTPESSLKLTSSSADTPPRNDLALPAPRTQLSREASRSSSSSSVRKGHVKVSNPKGSREHGSFPGSGALVPHPGSLALPRPSSSPDVPMPASPKLPSHQHVHELHLHQHRTSQQNELRLHQQNIQVGLDPVQVAQEAQQFQETMRGEAEQHVLVARAQFAELADQMRQEASQELAKMRREFQAEAQAREARLTQELRAQAADRERELNMQIQTLQYQLVTLQHQNRPPETLGPNSQSLNGTDVMLCLNELRAELQAMRANAATPHARPAQESGFVGLPPHAGVPHHALSPAHSTSSACAGILPPGSASHHAPPHTNSIASACVGIPPPGTNASSAYPTQRPPALPIAASIRQDPSPQHVHLSPGFPSSSSSSGSDSPHGDGGGGPPAGSPGSTPHGATHSRRSSGVGSAIVYEEGDVYRNKDLAMIKIDALPRDAANFRSWRNSFITRLCSIDRTGHDTLLHWIMPAFEASSSADLSDPVNLPRLDAHIAIFLADPKHMSSELGIQFQSYIEGCQLAYTAPKGRVLLQMVARRYFLDLRRGANLTEQALLELQLESFTYQSLLAFVNKVEYILNAIPPDLQPSEQTRFTWLFARLKRCRLIQRHIDRIKDARDGSHVRTWDWLFGKLKQAIAEMREDANETAIRESLGTSPKSHDDKAKAQKEKERRAKAKGAVASDKVGEAADAVGSQSTALPGKPKTGAKGPGKHGNPKAKGQGKGDDKGTGKGGAKGQGGKPPGESLRHRKRPEREHLQRRPTPRLRVCFGPKARVTVARTARTHTTGPERRRQSLRTHPPLQQQLLLSRTSCLVPTPPLSPTLPPCVTRVRCNRLCHLPRQSQIQPWIWSKLALISQV